MKITPWLGSLDYTVTELFGLDCNGKLERGNRMLENMNIGKIIT